MRGLWVIIQIFASEERPVPLCRWHHSSVLMSFSRPRVLWHTYSDNPDPTRLVCFDDPDLTRIVCSGHPDPTHLVCMTHLLLWHSFILKSKGFYGTKILIWVGGPDWAAFCIAGVLKTNVWLMMFYSLPIFFPVGVYLSLLDILFPSAQCWRADDGRLADDVAPLLPISSLSVRFRSSRERSIR